MIGYKTRLSLLVSALWLLVCVHSSLAINEDTALEVCFKDLSMENMTNPKQFEQRIKDAFCKDGTMLKCFETQLSGSTRPMDMLLKKTFTIKQVGSILAYQCEHLSDFVKEAQCFASKAGNSTNECFRKATATLVEDLRHMKSLDEGVKLICGALKPVSRCTLEVVNQCNKNLGHTFSKIADQIIASCGNHGHEVTFNSGSNLTFNFWCLLTLIAVMTI